MFFRFARVSSVVFALLGLLFLLVSFSGAAPDGERRRLGEPDSLGTESRERDIAADVSGVMKALEGVLDAVPKKRQKVEDLSLGDLLWEQDLWPSESFWPPHAAVRELKHRVQTLEKAGAARPFVCVDLRRFLPAWCPDTIPVLIDEETGRISSKDSGDKRIHPVQWSWAWDAYAMAAAALGQVGPLYSFELWRMLIAFVPADQMARCAGAQARCASDDGFRWQLVRGYSVRRAVEAGLSFAFILPLRAWFAFRPARLQEASGRCFWPPAGLFQLQT